MTNAKDWQPTAEQEAGAMALCAQQARETGLPTLPRLHVDGRVSVVLNDFSQVEYSADDVREAAGWMGPWQVEL